MAHLPSRTPAGGSESPGGERAWTRVAPVYAHTFAHFTTLTVAALLDEASVVAGARVLDLACGTGVATAGAAARGARALGADYSSGMLEQAARVAPEARFVRADAHHAPFRERAFDAVIMNFGIHTLADPARALRECLRVTRRGGALALTVWDAAERSEAQRLLECAVRARGEHPGLQSETSEFADPARAAAALAAAGYESIRSRGLDLVLRAADGREIFETFRTGTIRLAALLANQSQAALDRIRDEFLRSLAPWASAAGVAVPMRAILHAARRPAS